MHILVKHPLVDGDVEEAVLWYHERNPDAAGHLVDEVRHPMHAAALNPLQFSVRFEDVRRVRVRHFPHSVYFKVHDGTIFILAVLHGAREVEKLVLGTRTNR